MLSGSGSTRYEGGATWLVGTQDRERAEVAAYRDGVRIGREVLLSGAVAPERFRRNATASSRAV
jgi:hypothetical protein